MEKPRRSPQLNRPGSSPDGPEAAAAGTILGRRGGRAGSRAVIGGLLVAAAAVIVFAAALSAAGTGPRSYVVAERALPVGAQIGPGDLGTARLGLSGATRAAAFANPAGLVGRTVAVALQPGELIQTSMLGNPAGAGLRPVSIPVDADSLSVLSTGQAVDVIELASTAAGSSSAGSGSGSAPTVTVVLRGARLWSIARSDGGALSGTSGTTVVVTLGVADLSEAEAVVAASHAGTVELLQAEPSDGTGPGPSSG